MVYCRAGHCGGGIIGADLLTIPAQSQPLLGKTVADLISADTKVMANGDVHSTLHYVTGYEEYWQGKPDMQEGNNFPVKLEKSGAELETDVDGTQKTQAYPEDGLLIVRVPSQSTKVKIAVDSEELTTLNFATATLEQKTV